MNICDVIIIGAGPAGCTAAIYITRAGYKPVVFGGAAPGGQLLLTNEIENFPGLPEPVAGYELMDRMHRQIKRLGATLLTDDVASVSLCQKPFVVTSSSGEQYSCRAIIIATGSKARWLGIPSEERLRGHGVSACATCDGFFFKGKEVCVIGGGDTALTDALFLTKFVSKVTVVHRRDQLRASAVLVESAKMNSKIHFAWDSIVEEIEGADSVTGLRLKNVKTGVVSTIPCSAVFVAIGHESNTKMFDGKIDIDSHGYIITDRAKTSVEGVFAAGDVMDPYYKQAITAAGSGAVAAIEAERFLHTFEKV